jgi:predicted nucleotidyltransferase
LYLLRAEIAAAELARAGEIKIVGEAAVLVEILVITLHQLFSGAAVAVLQTLVGEVHLAAEIVGAVSAVVEISVAAEAVEIGEMNNEFANFIDDLRSTHGANLASVILYGSAAAGDFVAKASDYNLLIALHKISPIDLRNAQAPMREWRKMGHPLPVYFTVSELQNAADVFPIEFHQMEGARRVLFGEDVLVGLKISDEFLRHQTEYELRSKLLQLRRLYIPASTSVANLCNLMSESLTSFSAIFRAVLILHGEKALVTKNEIVHSTARLLNLDAKPFEKIFEFRKNDASNALGATEANQLFADYMEQIERVIDSVDRVRKS